MSEPEGPGGGSGSLTDQHLDDHRAYPPICKIRTSPACSPCLRGEYNSEDGCEELREGQAYTDGITVLI